MAHIHGNIANYPAAKRRRLLVTGVGIVMAAEFGLGFCVGFSVDGKA